MSSSSTSRLSFIDWMKAAGITIIVIGHVAARTSDWMTPPILPKQLGVAFFVFVTGYTLARERRPVSRVLYNRLFDVYLFGLLFALLWSAVGWFGWRDVAESNYLPLLGGVNVLFNFFPANPTTWYIGTYLHILLLWALVLRRVKIRWWMLIGAGALEIAIRAVLIDRVGGVLPYMVLPNWLLVLLLGLYAGQHQVGEDKKSPIPALAALVAVLGGWHLAVSSLVEGHQFPWMTANPGVPWGSWVVASLITVLYSGITVLMFAATRRISIPAVVTVLSRHTLFIFIAHMPLFYIVQPILRGIGLSYIARSTVLLILCLPGLVGLSALMTRLMAPAARRDQAVVLAARYLPFVRGAA